MRLFSYYPQASEVCKMHGLVPAYVIIITSEYLLVSV
jgi:hypothetical protein